MGKDEKTHGLQKVSDEDSMLPFEDTDILAVITALGLDLPNDLEDCVANEPLMIWTGESWLLTLHLYR